MMLTPSQDALVRRIDRCYLISSWARAPERRARYVDLARRYRTMLGQVVTAREGQQLHR